MSPPTPPIKAADWPGNCCEWSKSWSEQRGDLLQIIAGIRYFYRQFGYSYGLIRPPEVVVAPGQGGVAALEDDPDGYLGAYTPLMAALFPPLRLDLLTW